MEIVRTVDWMKQLSRAARAREHILGFVPTMGALHEGHFSLVREAQRRCSPVVVSIFVNPTQFGPSEDLAKYPRPFEADQAALEKMGVDYLFAPPVEQIYPRGFSTAVTVEGISERLEGRSRPGHFRGVATVVLKLLEIVQPGAAFFGRKDAQQLAVIRRMAADLALDAQIVGCPIVREPDGLALSSRNVYLDPAARRSAIVLYRALEAIRGRIAQSERAIAPLEDTMRQIIAAEPLVSLEYAEIADAETFERAAVLRNPCYALLAARVGGTRLIDNALIEPAADGFQVTL
jgi:pantoate--beta-alanine ligase